MKRLTPIQHLWTVYKEWHELFNHDHRYEPDRSWGPGPTNTTPCTPREFFNLIWDFTEYRDDVLDVTDGLLKRIATSMDRYCSEPNPERYQETYQNLIKHAKQLDLLK